MLGQYEIRGEPLTFEKLLLKLCLGDFDLHRSVDLLLMTALVVGVVLDGGREQSVDERGFSQSRLSSNLRLSGQVNA